MDDYDKRKLAKLEDLERRVNNAVDYFKTVIHILWLAIVLGAPALVFLEPLQPDRMIQSVMVFLLTLFCFGLGKLDKAVGFLK